MPSLPDLLSTPPRRIPMHRLGPLAVLGLGLALSLAGFRSTRDSARRQVADRFQGDARDASEAVFQGLRSGLDDLELLRGLFEASERVDRDDFKAFSARVLARHPFVQAFQWLPEVTPANRATFEAEARKRYPGFRFFMRDAAGQAVELPPDASFHAVQYVAPYEGNEVTLGFAAQLLATRQEALARALRTGRMAATGRVRLIQESGDQAGMLAMLPVTDTSGRAQGVVQGVFRMGDLVHKSLQVLEPRGLLLRLLDETEDPGGTLLHEEPARLPPVGATRADGLRLARQLELAGRRWRIEVLPAGGHYALGTPGRAWVVLGAGLAFTLLLAGHLRALQLRESEIRDEVARRTRELAQEVESHRRDLEALQASEARFRQLIELMGEGLWVLDGAERTTFMNRRMAQMLDLAPEQAAGRPLEAFLAEPGHLEDLAPEGRSVDLRLVRGDGRECWTLATRTPVRGAGGALVGHLFILTDITERRRQEQAQLQGQKLESLGVLAGGIAHDFNNLLTAVLGNLNLAQLELPPASPAGEYLEKMERTVQRATALTRQMLAYSGKGRFVVGPLDLNQLVQEMSQLLSVSISKKVALRFQLQEGLPCVVGEASQLQQVVMNLVTNASEAIGDAPGVVTIRTGCVDYQAEDLRRDFPGQPMEPGAHLVLEVSDTGHGMTPEVQARIFEPFFTTKFTGRGLGLSAMQGIVRGHRGGIRLYSEAGRGTTFRVVLPAGLGEAADPAIAEDAAHWRGSGTVLVVDDEPEVRQVASDLLRTLGFDVQLAEDGQQALERYRAEPGAFRALLMDLTMPRLDGAEAFRELRRLDPGCRVVLTSGYNEQEAIQDFLGKGLAGFVQKPFRLEDLRRALRAALED